LILCGVHISKQTKGGTAHCFSTDNASIGAVFCIFHIFMDARAAVIQCSDIGPKAQIANLGARIAQITPFYARNTFPPIEEAHARALVDDQVKAKSGAPATPPKHCLTGRNASGYRGMFHKPASDKCASEEGKLLSVDLLLVTNPCL
jgi:hypothetical protein